MTRCRPLYLLVLVILLRLLGLLDPRQALSPLVLGLGRVMQENRGLCRLLCLALIPIVTIPADLIQGRGLVLALMLAAQTTV